MVGSAKRLKRWLYLGHRWLGIVTCLFFVAWIGSGLVLLHVPFPRLTDEERLARLAPIDWSRVAVSPDAARAALPVHALLPVALEMRDDEPVYRLATANGERVTLSAANGTRVGPVSEEEARRIGGAPQARIEEVARDQWTVTRRYDPLRPFHKLVLGDAAGTELYVSQPTGEIALDTTLFERGWNWVGAVVHWIYPTVLRARPELWHEVVVWLSGIAIAGAVTGFVLGIWRTRLRQRYANGQITPYRGLARWHHLFGLGAGFFLTTFIVSGWLSMNPNQWFSSSSPPEAWLAAHAGPDGPIGLENAALQGLALPDSRRMQFSRVNGIWLATSETPVAQRVTTADGAAVPAPDRLTAAAGALVPGARLIEARVMSSYDAYWYPQASAPVLPVLRLVYDDPAATWLHLDPRDGAILNRLDRSGRVNRWLFDGLHRLDWPGLIENPLARTAAQWILNLLVLVIALTGVIAGWRRLARYGRQKVPQEPLS